MKCFKQTPVVKLQRYIENINWYNITYQWNLYIRAQVNCLRLRYSVLVKHITSSTYMVSRYSQHACANCVDGDIIRLSCGTYPHFISPFVFNSFAEVVFFSFEMLTHVLSRFENMPDFDIGHIIKQSISHFNSFKLPRTAFIQAA